MDSEDDQSVGSIPVRPDRVAGWMNQRQLEMIDYLREENRVLREQLAGRRLASTMTNAVAWPLGQRSWGGSA